MQKRFRYYQKKYWGVDPWQVNFPFVGVRKGMGRVQNHNSDKTLRGMILVNPVFHIGLQLSLLKLQA